MIDSTVVFTKHIYGQFWIELEAISASNSNAYSFKAISNYEPFTDEIVLFLKRINFRSKDFSIHNYVAEKIVDKYLLKWVAYKQEFPE